MPKRKAVAAPDVEQSPAKRRGRHHTTVINVRQHTLENSTPKMDEWPSSTSQTTPQKPPVKTRYSSRHAQRQDVVIQGKGIDESDNDDDKCDASVDELLLSPTRAKPLEVTPQRKSQRLVMEAVEISVQSGSVTPVKQLKSLMMRSSARKPAHDTESRTSSRKRPLSPSPTTRNSAPDTVARTSNASPRKKLTSPSSITTWSTAHETVARVDDETFSKPRLGSPSPQHGLTRIKRKGAKVALTSTTSVPVSFPTKKHAATVTQDDRCETPVPEPSPAKKHAVVQTQDRHEDVSHAASPTKKRVAAKKESECSAPEASASTYLPRSLPTHLHTFLFVQKRAMLAALHDPPTVSINLVDTSDEDEAEPALNDASLRQLIDLLNGTVERQEGNSCLIIGPKGSGKTRVFENALRSLSSQPIIVRLSGHVQHNDRLAMREIARQVSLQIGSSKLLLPSTTDDNENPFFDRQDYQDDEESNNADMNGILPPSAHLPSLIASLSSLPRPVVVLMDAFDLFTGHARQALLYCLLDAVQSCRSGGANKGLAVVGITARVDVVNLLEKRVKSRFSHRILRTAGCGRVQEWVSLLQQCLCIADDSHGGRAATEDSQSREEDLKSNQEWQGLWRKSVVRFLNERAFKEMLNDTFGITRDLRVLTRIMTGAVLELTPESPFLTSTRIQPHVMAQRNPPRAAMLSSLPYPSVALLIAAQHVRTSGHDTFTFEMLHERFREQVRTSAAAPVMVGGGGIGMMSVGRAVLMGSFEHLVQIGVFKTVGGASAGHSREFVKHRCAVDRDEVKGAVEGMGQTNLKKWLSKAS